MNKHPISTVQELHMENSMDKSNSCAPVEEVSSWAPAMLRKPLSSPLQNPQNKREFNYCVQ